MVQDVPTNSLWEIRTFPFTLFNLVQKISWDSWGTRPWEYKENNHYQMFTTCRHCTHCFTHILFKTDKVSAIISILQMRKLKLKVTLLASGRFQSSCSYPLYSVIPTKLICRWGREDSPSPSHVNCDECHIRYRNKVPKERTEKTT